MLVGALTLEGMKDIDRSKIHVYAEVVKYFWNTTEDGTPFPDHDIKMKTYLKAREL